jgi:hypothetical protein
VHLIHRILETKATKPRVVVRARGPSKGAAAFHCQHRACLYLKRLPHLLLPTETINSKPQYSTPDSSSRNMASKSATPQSEADQDPDHQKPVGFLFPAYLPTLVEPCAVDANTKSVPFHLLSCGHVVAVDTDDTRCGINCLHVATWITQKQSALPEDSVYLKPGKTLRQAVSNSAPYQPVTPPQTSTQTHDRIYCEICQGMPFASYNIGAANHEYRRALGLTRPVIEHFTIYGNEAGRAILEYQIAPLFHNPESEAYDPMNTHYLACGHQVWCATLRPCAANCKDMPPCRGRTFPYNVKQGDAIVCKECTYRAELVYSRYVTTGLGAAHEEALRNGLVNKAPQIGRRNVTAGGQSSANGPTLDPNLQSETEHMDFN